MCLVGTRVTQGSVNTHSLPLAVTSLSLLPNRVRFQWWVGRQAAAATAATEVPRGNKTNETNETKLGDRFEALVFDRACSIKISM